MTENYRPEMSWGIASLQSSLNAPHRFLIIYCWKSLGEIVTWGNYIKCACMILQTTNSYGKFKLLYKRVLRWISKSLWGTVSRVLRTPICGMPRARMALYVPFSRCEDISQQSFGHTGDVLCMSKRYVRIILRWIFKDIRRTVSNVHGTSTADV